MHLDNFSTDVASFRVPRYVIANLESLRHIVSSLRIRPKST
jgi:hypothetical protein